MVARHPEIREELERIELALEGLAMADAAPVDAAVLDGLLKDIRTQQPASAETATQQVSPPKTPTPKIARGPLSLWLPWALVVAGLGALWFYNDQLSDQQLANEGLQLRYDQLEKECNVSQDALQNAQQYINTLTNTATQNIVLAAAGEGSDKSAAVFYNPAIQQTLFVATNLPAPPTGKQYQLWAIDGEGPKDLGVLATNLDGKTILEVKHLSNVAAFAITLEDAGGKPTPDLTQLQVIGNLAG